MTASNLQSEPCSAIYPYVLLSTYRLLVCQVCEFASVADEVATHLRTRHRDIQPERRQELVEKINQIPNILRNQDELRDLRYPTNMIEPIPYLVPPKPDGLKCRACGHIVRRVQKIQKHCTEKHQWINPRGRGRPPPNCHVSAYELPWEERVACQRFFPSREASKWFQVNIQTKEQANKPRAKPSAKKPQGTLQGLTSVASTHLQQVIDRETQYREAMSQPRATVNHTGTDTFPATSLWLDRTQWPSIYQGSRRDVLQALTRLPNRHSLNADYVLGQGTLQGAPNLISPRVHSAKSSKPGADVDKADNDGCTPLGSASRHGHKAIVQLLLDKKAIVDKAEKPEWIALHQASFYGHRAVVKLLLDRKANIAIRDSDKRTALHKASQQGYEATVQLLVESQASLDAVDKDGWTALHFASFHCPEDVQRLDDDEMGSTTNDRNAITGTAEHTGQHDDVVRLLLSSGANPAWTTINLETALHLAATKNSGNRVKMLLDKMRESERAAADINGATALYIAAERRNPDAVYQLLEGLQTADFGQRDIEKDTLIWAAEKEETHKIVQLLFQKSKIKATGSKFFPPDNKWSALEWAGYAGSLQVVCHLLRASAPTPENDRKRKSAGRLVGKILDAMRYKRMASAGEGRHENSTGDDGEGQAEKNQSYLLEDYKLIRDVLGDPPIFKTSSPRPCVKPRLEFAIPSFEAAIVDFYAWGERTGFLRRFRSVRDVIYNEGPNKIMLEARESQPKVNAAMQQGTADLGPDEDPLHSDHLKFRWIHLPANNMQWMNDLTLRIFIDDEKPEVDFADFSSFVRKSWHETPDAVSKSRFMKPVCVANGDTQSSRGPRTSGPATRRVLSNNQEGQLGDYSTDIDVDSRVQNKRGHQLALYMPYLTFARETQDTKDSPEYTNLLECYKQNVIHGSRTLDEFFYHFAQDAKLKSEMQRRNGDQVVTREINGPTKGLECWTILRVDQLWLWIVDEKTIITSSTHRVDGAEDPVLTRVLNRLSKESDGWRGQSQPDSAITMARLIVDSCTEFYDLPVEIECRDREAQKAVVSTRQIFLDAIAKAAIIEANLFESFTNPDKRSHDKQDAAKLLYHVKDIRDELNILKAVATHQSTVEGGFPGGLSPGSYLAS
ncbi:hypothetical protein DER46DRAFT_645872 [Fusarium sp. MPI-SDFR-AT-0072]|nr:hypothetical protein DER46DRAFT_645872 [Fusarium sp. MPI-SDFR-AT-0072]